MCDFGGVPGDEPDWFRRFEVVVAFSGSEVRVMPARVRCGDDTPTPLWVGSRTLVLSTCLGRFPRMRLSAQQAAKSAEISVALPRVSVGIEDLDDLWHDVELALER